MWQKVRANQAKVRATRHQHYMPKAHDNKVSSPTTFSILRTHRMREIVKVLAQSITIWGSCDFGIPVVADWNPEDKRLNEVVGDTAAPLLL